MTVDVGLIWVRRLEQSMTVYTRLCSQGLFIVPSVSRVRPQECVPSNVDVDANTAPFFSTPVNVKIMVMMLVDCSLDGGSWSTGSCV